MAYIEGFAYVIGIAVTSQGKWIRSITKHQIGCVVLGCRRIAVVSAVGDVQVGGVEAGIVQVKLVELSTLVVYQVGMVSVVSDGIRLTAHGHCHILVVVVGQAAVFRIIDRPEGGVGRCGIEQKVVGCILAICTSKKWPGGEVFSRGILYSRPDDVENGFLVVAQAVMEYQAIVRSVCIGLQQGIQSGEQADFHLWK